MKPINTVTNIVTNIESDKKEWISPEIAELPVEETSQLNPPSDGGQQLS